jgi:hypothetical protein
MRPIKKIIPKRELKLYNIPDNFGEIAEINIKLAKLKGSGHELSSLNIGKIQEESGMMQMLYQPEENYWNELNRKDI